MNVLRGRKRAQAVVMPVLHVRQHSEGSQRVWNGALQPIHCEAECAVRNRSHHVLGTCGHGANTVIIELLEFALNSVASWSVPQISTESDSSGKGAIQQAVGEVQSCQSDQSRDRTRNTALKSIDTNIQVPA